MIITIKLEIPVVDGDMPVTPILDVSQTDSYSKESDYQLGVEFAKFVSGNTPSKFFDGLREELNRVSSSMVCEH